MSRWTVIAWLLAWLFAWLLTGCGGPEGAEPGAATAGRETPGEGTGAPEPELELVAESAQQWTGVAVTPRGRVFVSYPRWHGHVPVSVAALDDGEPEPFPSEAWNDWSPGQPLDEHWVAVQSVVVDAAGRLWVLDTGNPRFEGVVEGAPKLVAFDPETGRELTRIAFAAPVVTPSSYLNDVRVDVEAERAYLTDSGDGALIVVDLARGEARRRLDDHPSTEAADDFLVRIGGEPWLRGGRIPRVHSDGIALDAEGGHLYFKALTGPDLYRVPLAALNDASLSPGALGARVERVAEPGPADGLLFGPDERVWITAIDESALEAFDPADKSVTTIVADPRLAWPDSLAWGPDGFLYVTTSQIHRAPDPPVPYRVFRLRPPAPR